MNYILISTIIILTTAILAVYYKTPIESLENKEEKKPVVHKNKLLFKLGDDKINWSSPPTKGDNSLVITKQVGTINLNKKIENDFTIIAIVKTLGKDQMKFNNILSASGNQSTALDFNIPNEYGSVNLKVGESRYRNKRNRTNHFNTYILTHKDGDTDFYVNGIKDDIKINPDDDKTLVYFNTNTLTINKNKEGQFSLKNLHIYDNFMTSSQIKKETEKIKKGNNKPKENNKPKKDGMNNEIISYMKNGNYYIYIHKNSKWYNKFHKYGPINYGPNRERAESLFKQNFPGVSPPKHLDQTAPNPSANLCNFIGNKNNPCITGHCRDTEWNENPLKIKKLTNKCKTNVTSYCKEFSDKDPFCVAWSKQSDTYNTRHAKNIRRVFGEPQIISEIDMKNYIRKDRIPCWGCTLD